MTHVFALAHLLGRPGAARWSTTASRRCGAGWPTTTTAAGSRRSTSRGPGDPDKTAYEHAFVVLAAASAEAAGRPGGTELLDDALAVLLGKFWDDEHGMVVEQWDQGWTTLDPYRGVKRQHAHGRGAARRRRRARRRRAARACAAHRRAGRARRAARTAGGCPEHFDAEWTPILDYNRDEPAHPFRPYGATVGHWLEWARLALHLHAALGTPLRRGWSADAKALFDPPCARAGRSTARTGSSTPSTGTAARRAPAHALGGRRGDRDGGRAAPGDRRGAYDAWYRTGGTTSRRAFRDAERAPGTTSSTRRTGRSGVTWQGKPDVYHAYQATLIPRLPLAPTLVPPCATGCSTVSDRQVAAS